MFFTTLVLLSLVGGLLYLFLTWNFGYWKKRGIKEVTAYPITGSFPSIFNQKRNLGYDFDDIYKQYKNDEYFVGVIVCRIPQLVVLTPEYAHKIYVNDFRYFHDNEVAYMMDNNTDNILKNNPFFLKGEEWKERRIEVTPGLTANRISAVYPATLEVCDALVKFVKQLARVAPPEGLDTKNIALRFTTEVVTDCVLGIKATSFTDNSTPIYNMIKKCFEQSTAFTIYAALYNILPQIKYIYSARVFTKDAEQFFFGLIKSAVELRAQTKGAEDRNDFLNFLLYLKEKKGLDIFELTAHTITFLTDGFETTALVIAHLLLLLARNPEAQENIRDEAGEKELSFEDLSSLDYLEACIHETMRIFPSVIAARKMCTAPYEFVNKNGKKVQLKPGEVAVVPIFSIQRDPDIYEDPESFKPERFLNGGLKKYQSMGAYFGFGDGPRMCLGMRFAMTQMKSAIVALVRAFNIKPNPKTRTDNVLDDTYFMSTLKGGIYLDFEERN